MQVPQSWPSNLSYCDNGFVPFTLSHIAAAVPFRRKRLVLSAVVAGTMAPDFEYFVRLSPGGGWGHSIVGAFCLSLPLGLAVLWLFHAVVKFPAVALLPRCVECRLATSLRPFRFRGRILLIVTSLLAGIATHLAWDSFTHSQMWLYHHWAFLRGYVRVPVHGSMRTYKFLQYISSLAGGIVLVWWFLDWYRHAQPGPQPLRSTLSPSQKALIVSSMFLLSGAGGILRALLRYGVPHSHAFLADFAGVMIVTTGALLWWQLVAWGVIFRARLGELAATADLVHR